MKIAAQSKLLFHLKMYSQILVLTIFFVLKVSTFDMYLTNFPKWISNNNTFNSFILPANELQSTILQNSSSRDCVRLDSNEIKSKKQVLSAWCYYKDPKCDKIEALNLKSIAPLNVCKLHGNLINVSIILEHDEHQENFIYVLVEGCYNLTENHKTDYIWAFTNNTYLKYSIDDIAELNKSKSVSVKVIDEIQFSIEGNSCLNLCTALHCDISPVRDIYVSDEEPTKILEITKGSFIKSLYIFGILTAIIITVGGFIYVFYKFYNKG